MSLFAIADTHLSFGTNKPMDSFIGWTNYVSRLEENWNNVVKSDDSVVIAGDISWAMNFDELVADFDFLHKLNGTKIILKGNHDYWWNTRTKIEAFIAAHGFDSIQILHNSACAVGTKVVCGSRGWMFDNTQESNQKILNREVMRLKLSIDAGKKLEGTPIVFLHYPPITASETCNGILALLKAEKIERCYYGHLHGASTRYAVNEVVEGIRFALISADYLEFCPILIEKF